MTDTNIHTILINLIAWIFIMIIPPYILSRLLIKRLNLENELIKSLLLLTLVLFNTYIARNFLSILGNIPLYLIYNRINDIKDYNINKG